MGIKDLVHILSTEPYSTAIHLLQKRISGESGFGPCVYFAASLLSAKRILESGVLLPRNALENLNEDISSTGVQARRGEIWLGNGIQAVAPKRATHDCLNFFFNPMNRTVDAFCRNQVVKDGPPIQIVIFEFPLNNIANVLKGKTALWACSRRNIASGGYTESRVTELQASWQWQAVFSTATEDHFRDEVSGEFLLWIQSSKLGTLEGIPVAAASRLLVSNPTLLNKSRFNVVRYKCFNTIEELLRAERLLQQFIEYQPIVAFLDALDSFDYAVSRLPFRLSATDFSNQELATSDLHGIPHVTRVMLWCHILTARKISAAIHVCDENIDKLKDDTLLAALIHDLCRKTDHEDSDHGRAAANHFFQAIWNACEGNDKRVKRITEAVEFHCLPDSSYPNANNPVYKVLKDADALDRGRFAGLCEGIDFAGTGCEESRCNHMGCAYKTLRLNYEGIAVSNPSWPFRKNIGMAAWNVARATKSAPWEYNSPIHFLTEWLLKGQQALHSQQ